MISSPPTPSTVTSTSSLSSSHFTSRTQCCIPIYSMYITCPLPRERQQNCNKCSAPLRENQYNSKPHTSHAKRGASNKVKPPPENQQAPQVIQDKKNSKNTPFSDLSDSSIAAAVLWNIFVENQFFLLNTLALLI